MQVNDENIDELFAQRLGNMEVPPPEDGWRRIESVLNGRRRIVRRYWFAAASAVLILGFAASVAYLQKNTVLPDNPSVTASEDMTDDYHTNGNTYPDENTNADENINVITAQTLLSDETVEAIRQPNIRNTEVENISLHESSPETRPETNEQPVESTPDRILQATGRDIPEKQLYTPAYIEPREQMSGKQLLQINRIGTLTRQPDKLAAADVKISGAVTTTDLPVYDLSEPYPSYYADLPAKSKPDSRWEITGRVAPIYSYRAITNIPDGLNRSDFNSAENAILAYSGGLTVAYNVLGRLSIQTGVFYTQMGQSVNNIVPYSNMYAAASTNGSYTKNLVRTSSGDVVVTSNLKTDTNSEYASYFNAAHTENTSGTSSVSTSANYRLIQRIDYLEIPVILRYILVDRKADFYFLGGMSTNILIDNNIFLDNGRNLTKDGELLMARPLNYSSTIGLGFSYQVMKNLLIDIEPSFKYYLQSYTTNGSINTNPYAIGVYTGIIYKF
jgi:hypothetical protein